MPQGKGHLSSSKFSRIFDPEFLSTRKDILPVEMSCAEGKIEEVVRAVTEDPSLVLRKNKDSNTLLLIAVANEQWPVADALLTLKSDLHVKNSQKLDALDYAVMESPFSKTAKVVLSACDFVVTEIFDGPFEKIGRQAMVTLMDKNHKLARSTILGKTPDFADIFGRQTDYRKEWVKNLKYLCETVRKGLLLLDDDIAYLERDSLISGALEVPVSKRYVYRPNEDQVMRFTELCRHVPAYEQGIEKRLIETSFKGDAIAVQGLLKAKAPPNVEDTRGESVLLRAAHNGDTLTVKCLLVAKAAINATNKDGFTALHIAAVRNNVDAIQVLLRAKADLFARSHRGNSVLDFCKHEGHKELLEVLQEERSNRRSAGYNK